MRFPPRDPLIDGFIQQIDKLRTQLNNTELDLSHSERKLSQAQKDHRRLEVKYNKLAMENEINISCKIPGIEKLYSQLDVLGGTEGSYGP